MFQFHFKRWITFYIFFNWRRSFRTTILKLDFKNWTDDTFDGFLIHERPFHLNRDRELVKSDDPSPWSPSNVKYHATTRKIMCNATFDSILSSTKLVNIKMDNTLSTLISRSDALIRFVLSYIRLISTCSIHECVLTTPLTTWFHAKKEISDNAQIKLLPPFLTFILKKRRTLSSRKIWKTNKKPPLKSCNLESWQRDIFREKSIRSSHKSHPWSNPRINGGIGSFLFRDGSSSPTWFSQQKLGIKILPRLSLSNSMAAFLLVR